jgi:hypothetical protein
LSLSGLEVPFEFQYTERMKNKNTRQFDSIEAIDLFLAEADNGTLDNIWENVQDSFEESSWVSAFNHNLKNLHDLTLTDGELVGSH